MVFVSTCITFLLLSTIAFADYYVDNANTSVVYSMSPNQSGQSWQTFILNGSLELYQPISNSTGNYSIFLDPTNCYDQNYARAICGTNDTQCFIQIPFTDVQPGITKLLLLPCIPGSGITMYVFNAGARGTTANFSMDGGATVSSSIAPPTTAENFQMSNVSLYSVQGLPSGDHTIKMTPIDWAQDPGVATDMKFDYAYVNETFVAIPSSTPTTTSTANWSSSQTPTASNRIDAGGIVGITLGIAAILGGIVIGILWFRKRKASHRGSSSSAFKPTFQIEPLTSEYLRSVTPSYRPHGHDNSFLSRQSNGNSAVPPLMPSTTLRDAHAVGSFPPSIPIQRRSIMSAATASFLQPLLRHSADNKLFVSSSMPGPVSHTASALSESAIASRYNLNPAQVETVRGLVADRVPTDTIARVIEAFVPSRFSTGEVNAGHVIPSIEYTMQSPPTRS